MATFPVYAKVAAAGYSESHADIALRSEMDRGLPKQRKAQSDVIVTVSLTLYFYSKADAANFEDWYYAIAQAGAAWFDWTDPRTGIVRQARVVAGTLGPLTPRVRTFVHTERTLQIEYLRAI